MNTNASSFSAAERENLRARFGMRVATALSDRADAAPHDISERLRIAREQALQRARQAAKPAAAPVSAPANVVLGGARSGTLSLGGGQPSWWFRFAAVLPMIVLAAGLVMIDRLHDREQTTAAAEIDSALLADDLPPDAYSDPGFVQYMKSADSL